MVFPLLISQSLYDTQIKVNVLEKEYLCQLVVCSPRLHWKVSLGKATKTAATDPEVLNSSEMQGHS